MYQVKELVQPTDIVFPLTGISKHVELISPGEEFVVVEPETGDSKESDVTKPVRAYSGPTRLAYIGSQAWKKLQYSERLKNRSQGGGKGGETTTGVGTADATWR